MEFRLAYLAPRYWPTALGLVLLRIFEPLPYPVLVGLGTTLGAIVRRLPIAFVRTARRNLELCLPELDPATRERVLAQHFHSLGISLFETAIAWWSSDRRVLRLTELEGAEHLERVLRDGHGAILLSAHFTPIEIGVRALTARMPMSVMYRPTKNELLGYFLARNRARRLRRAIPRDDIRTLISSLAANEPVWYATDQSYRKKGAEMVPFFGIPAATNTATSRIAKMTGAAVLPFFPERLPRSQGYRMVIHPPLENFPGEDRVVDATRLNALIEAQVRHVPAQYLWIHRRLKGLSATDPDHYASVQ
ncbi:MAG TPA: LpxL/LpxP family Kdo(2)-lipid IV(A) lauroyl/palmitoleoyl acyltransferase [Steroidobacteraceae bacterium]|nr:LpxL/LpxP family Kdo(2)-lipid IV(A) lauroyl/palmitoleoyl acyltransferase [Steroidobacteraceae bacterium]